jgi:hypothetical protein
MLVMMFVMVGCDDVCGGDFGLWVWVWVDELV